MNHKRQAKAKPSSAKPAKENTNRPWWRNLDNPFRLDLTSLAIYRVGLGLILLYDTINRWIDLTAHYTDQGVYSMEAAKNAGSFSFSLHFLIDGWWWPALLFAVQLVAVIFLIVGYRTRLMTALCWVLVVSLQNRNPIVLDGADVLIRTMLFWSIFLPLNRRFSLDLAHQRVINTAARTAFTPATIAIVVQTILMYAQTAALKTGPTWRENYDALYYALNAEQFSSPLGVWFSQFKDALRWMTRGAIAVEDWAPLLVLNPFYGRFTRVIGFLVIAGLHAGIIVLMFIGVFQFISIVTIIPLIPTFVWDKLRELVEKKRPVEKLTVYYDTSCGMCKAFVKILAAFAATRDEVKVKSIYDSKTILNKSVKNDSWVAISDGRTYYFADVLREILRRSYVWWIFAPLLKTQFMQKFANKIYHIVSSRRKSICKPPKQQNRLWVDLKEFYELAFKYVGGATILILLAASIVWVWADSPKAKDATVGQPYRRALTYTRLDQMWNMFAPNPINYNSWYIVKGTTVNGEVLDVWRHYWVDGDDTFSKTRPDHAYRTYVDKRWRRYLTRIQEPGYASQRLGYLDYLCRDWNQKNPNRKVTDLELIMMNEPTRIDNQPEKVDEILQEVHNCQT